MPLGFSAKRTLGHECRSGPIFRVRLFQKSPLLGLFLFSERDNALISYVAVLTGATHPEISGDDHKDGLQREKLLADYRNEKKKALKI